MNDLATAQLRARRAVARIVRAEDVDDVLQDAAVKALRFKRQFEGRSSFNTYFYKIAVNEALYLARKPKPRKTVSIEEMDFESCAKSPEQLAAEAQRNERLYAAIMKLSPKLKAMAAKMLRGELCVGSAEKALRFRARHKLREMLCDASL